jgi:hypothetical protein
MNSLTSNNLREVTEEKYESVSGSSLMFRTSIQGHLEGGNSDQRKVLGIIILDEDMIHWTPGGLQEQVLIVTEITAFTLLRN